MTQEMPSTALRYNNYDCSFMVRAVCAHSHVEIIWCIMIEEPFVRKSSYEMYDCEVGCGHSHIETY